MIDVMSSLWSSGATSLRLLVLVRVHVSDHRRTDEEVIKCFDLAGCLWSSACARCVSAVLM